MFRVKETVKDTQHNCPSRGTQSREKNDIHYSLGHVSHTQLPPQGEAGVNLSVNSEDNKPGSATESRRCSK